MRHTPASVIKERHARLVREHRLVTDGQRKPTAVGMALVEFDERHQACYDGHIAVFLPKWPCPVIGRPLGYAEPEWRGSADDD